MQTLAQKQADTQTMLQQICDTHDRMVLWASGGVDSTLLLWLCRAWAPRLSVFHVARDESFPDVTETLIANAMRWGYGGTLTLLRPWRTMEQYIQQFGWPVDIVPTALEGGTAVADSVYRTSPVKVSSWWHCTYVRCTYPLMLATAAYQAEALLTGSRLEDAPANAPFAAEVPPVPQGIWTRYNPLADWTRAEIWTVADEVQLPLPPLYAQWKRRMSLIGVECSDCLRCSWVPEMWTAVLPIYYPDVYAKYWPEVRAVYQVVRQALQHEQQRLAALPLIDVLP